MFRLTREVRFALNAAPDRQLAGKPTNSHGGFPTMTGLGRYYTVRVSLAGELDPQSQYLLNIKDVDDTVRRWLAKGERQFSGVEPTAFLRSFQTLLRKTWPHLYEAVSLQLTPTLSIASNPSERTTMRLSQKFEFSASHRLHNSSLTDEQNRQLFGKCNNPLGHGHNYEVQVTVRGEPDAIAGRLADLPQLERLVDETVLARFDHKHLNLELPEFADVNPTVENIAKTIYTLLKENWDQSPCVLASVTVWETPKTWCEYGE